MKDLKWKADIINSDGTSQSYTSDNYSELEFNEVKDELDTVLLDKIALLERKLELCKEQRDDALSSYYGDYWMGQDIEELNKKLEELK